ncbi:MAG: NIPSNAP family protein, partial [Phycisphaerae bacterium]|nr:NIPSNAP family protein [Phycisphaerae bacterium]
DLMSQALGVEVRYTLGAHNMMYPVVHPATGETVHLIGFQGNIRGKNHLCWKGSRLYGGAMYAIRTARQTYTLGEVNNAYSPGKAVLVSPRAFCLSPFQDNHLYVGGHDSSRKISDDMAWIFKAPLDVALGVKAGRDASPPRPPTPPAPRLLAGPVYELRIYVANEGRFQHLIKRFGEHTDRIFKKHGLEPVGYWIPTDGRAGKRRRFVYILKHPSRYAAYKNWNRFSNDREWQAVLDRPEFQRLLSEKPTSIFMTATDYSARSRNTVGGAGGVYELRTYTANADKVDALNSRFREHTTGIFNTHGIRNVGYWTPFDRPESADTLIYLVHHASRKQADANWKAFSEDPRWRKVARESQADGKLLARPPDRIYLKAMAFSPLK